MERIHSPKAENQLDFEIIEEGWNEYALSDNSKLRVRTIVTKIFDAEVEDPQGNPILGIASVTLASANVPPELWRKDESTENEINVGETYLDFHPEREVWNKYKVETGHLLKVKLIVSQVIRTPNYTKFGEPNYQVKSENVTSVEPFE